ncbi:DUF7543 family protein [Salinigranum sp. GCM10025319]|uniref:DUF7543 family protein n=1 Tax=Salinigranum sp. GCM10025319 TaxID=3252687 RepID=UPI00361C36B5
MGWTERSESSVVEWERTDGWATIRLRERADEGWVIRLDRLTQAPEGALFREERVETRADAEDVAAEWREAYDAPEGDRTD